MPQALHDLDPADEVRGRHRALLAVIHTYHPGVGLSHHLSRWAGFTHPSTGLQVCHAVARGWDSRGASVRRDPRQTSPCCADGRHDETYPPEAGCSYSSRPVGHHRRWTAPESDGALSGFNRARRPSPLAVQVYGFRPPYRGARSPHFQAIGVTCNARVSDSWGFSRVVALVCPVASRALSYHRAARRGVQPLINRSTAGLRSTRITGQEVPAALSRVGGSCARSARAGTRPRAASRQDRQTPPHRSGGKRAACCADGAQVMHCDMGWVAGLEPAWTRSTA